MVKPENPFLVQQKRIKTLSSVRKAIRGRKITANEIAVPTTSLTHKATTVNKDDIKANDFISFIETVETEIRNRVPLPLPSVISPQIENQFEKLANIIIPEWVAQFKRMYRKALKEGNISIDKLKVYEQEFQKIIKPFFSIQNYDDIKTATHTNIPFDVLSSRGDVKRPPKFPKGSISNEFMKQYTQNNNPIVLGTKIKQMQPKVQETQEIINNTDRLIGWARSQNNSGVLVDARNVRAKAEKYKRELMTSDIYQDIEKEQQLVDLYRALIDKVEKIAAREEEETKDVEKLQKLYRKTSEDLDAIGITYLQVLTRGMPQTEFDIIEYPEFRKYFDYFKVTGSMVNSVGQRLQSIVDPSGIPQQAIIRLYAELEEAQNRIDELNREGQRLDIAIRRIASDALRPEFSERMRDMEEYYEEERQKMSDMELELENEAEEDEEEEEKEERRKQPIALPQLRRQMPLPKFSATTMTSQPVDLEYPSRQESGEFEEEEEEEHGEGKRKRRARPMKKIKSSNSHGSAKFHIIKF